MTESVAPFFHFLHNIVATKSLFVPPEFIYYYYYYFTHMQMLKSSKYVCNPESCDLYTCKISSKTRFMVETTGWKLTLQKCAAIKGSKWLWASSRVRHMIRHPVGHCEKEKMERASDEPCFLTSVHFETVRKHSWEILPCRTSRRDRTSRFASKLFSLSGWGPLKSWLFWLKRTVCLLYIMMPVLLAPGNVWSQMEFSSEFHLCVSQRALGSSSSIAYSDRVI